MYKTNKEILAEFDEKFPMNQKIWEVTGLMPTVKQLVSMENLKSHISLIRQNDLKELMEWAEENGEYVGDFGHIFPKKVIKIEDFLSHLQSLLEQ